MTEKDFEIFSNELLNCFDILGERSKVLTEKTIELYFNTLIEYAIDYIIPAIQECNKTCKFFPRPADIIEKIEGREDDIIDAAWIKLKNVLDNIGFHDSIVFKDRIITLSVMDMGGLQEVHDKIFRGNNKSDSAFFDFKRSYKRYLKMERAGHIFKKVRCPGYSEGLGGVFNMVFIDEGVILTKWIIPAEWRPQLEYNRNARLQLEGGEEQKAIENKIDGQTIDEIMDNMTGIEKIK